MKRFICGLAFVFATTFMLAISDVKAEGTVDEIRINSTTTSVTEGALPSYTATTTTEHVTGIEEYGSNTTWLKWTSGMSSWYGFGTDAKTAVADGTTHYALRLKVDLESGYSFTSNTKIYFNNVDVTSNGHTCINVLDWGGYVVIDLGTANVAQPIIQLTPITTMNVTIKAPIIGTTVETKNVNMGNMGYLTQTILPTIELESGANYVVGDTYYISAFPSENPSGYDEMFVGTFEEGKTYYVEVYITPKEGFMFDPGIKVTINGAESYEMSDFNGPNQVMFYAKVKPVKEESKTEEKTEENNSKVLNGGNQEFTPSATAKLQFRFDIPFNEFKESGKVYIDGKLVDSANYTLSEGSTIVTFTSNYSSSLAAGNHTIRMVSANNDVSTDFKVVTNPKTSDNIMSYVLLILTSICGLYVISKKITKNTN